MIKIIDNAPKQSLSKLAQYIQNYSNEIITHFMTKTVQENAIQSWASCLGDNFARNFSQDSINDTNYHFFVYALRKCNFDNVEKYFNRLSQYVSNKEDLLALHSIYPDKLKSLFNICIPKLSLSEIISVISNINDSVEVNLSPYIESANKNDLQNMLSIIGKLNLESLTKLETKLLTLEFNELRLEVLKEIHKITSDQEIIQKSFESGSELGSYISAQSHANEIIQKCIENPNNVGFALALLHKVQESGEISSAMKTLQTCLNFSQRSQESISSRFSVKYQRLIVKRKSSCQLWS